MDLLESVMLCMLVALLIATVTARSAGSELRDVGLLAALATVWGAGTASAVVMRSGAGRMMQTLCTLRRWLRGL